MQVFWGTNPTDKVTSHLEMLLYFMEVMIFAGWEGGGDLQLFPTRVEFLFEILILTIKTKCWTVKESLQ